MVTCSFVLAGMGCWSLACIVMHLGDDGIGFYILSLVPIWCTEIAHLGLGIGLLLVALDLRRSAEPHDKPGRLVLFVCLFFLLIGLGLDYLYFMGPPCEMLALLPGAVLLFAGVRNPGTFLILLGALTALILPIPFDYFGRFHWVLFQIAMAASLPIVATGLYLFAPKLRSRRKTSAGEPGSYGKTLP